MDTAIFFAKLFVLLRYFIRTMYRDAILKMYAAKALKLKIIFARMMSIKTLIIVIRCAENDH